LTRTNGRGGVLLIEVGKGWGRKTGKTKKTTLQERVSHEISGETIEKGDETR